MPRIVAVDIASALKQRIFSGEWTSGRMPPERELAAEFGVARNTIRRAVEYLEKDGTVERHVGRGTFLASTDAASLSNVVSRMQGTSPADMMEIRKLLEPSAAAFAATNASASELEAVRLAHVAACDAMEVLEFEHCDSELHHRIFACSRNEFLKEIHNLLRIVRNQAPWFDMKQRNFSPETRLLYCDEHGAIVTALLHRDSDGARRAMMAHLDTVGRNLLGR
jgi:GntR family transcriptional regulator, hexuronate regulon transcriptional repressor